MTDTPVYKTTIRRESWQDRRAPPTAQRGITPTVIDATLVPCPLIHDQYQYKWGRDMEIPAERCYETRCADPLTGITFPRF